MYTFYDFIPKLFTTVYVVLLYAVLCKVSSCDWLCDVVSVEEVNMGMLAELN